LRLDDDYRDYQEDSKYANEFDIHRNCIRRRPEAAAERIRQTASTAGKATLLSVLNW
jgi:hypothetical protein